MVIADIAVMPLIPCVNEDEIYKVIDKVIEYIGQSGLKYEVGYKFLFFYSLNHIIF